MSKDKYVKIGKMNMYYEESGCGLPLILIHGGTAVSGMWKDIVPLLSKHYRVITPDSRGHGKTDNPTKTMTYPLLADDIASFIKTLNLKKPFICGHSDGGQIALELAMRYVGLCSALVIASAYYVMPEQFADSLKKFGFLSKGKVDLQYIRKKKSNNVKFWKEVHIDNKNPNKWIELLQQISEMWWTPFQYNSEDFNKIKDPTLILTGDRDEYIPVEQALHMYNSIKNSELAVLPGTSHVSFFDEPELFTKAVLNFLERQKQ